MKDILERNNLDSFDKLLEHLNISYNLTDYGITANDAKNFINSVINKKNLLITPKKTSANDILKIYLSRFYEKEM